MNDSLERKGTLRIICYPAMVELINFSSLDLRLRKIDFSSVLIIAK
jgi:hypothetical protein